MRTFLNMPIRTIQLYARLDELVFTEPPIIDMSRLKDRADDYGLQMGAIETGCPTLNAAEYYPQFLKDIERTWATKGVRAPKYQLHIHPNGVIGDGNFRGHWWRWANLDFLPINLNYMICNSSELWNALYPADGKTMQGKAETTFQRPRHINYEGAENWWELESRHFLQGKLKRGPADKTFNLSYENCKARLET